jgi:hypothetical protein
LNSNPDSDLNSIPNSNPNSDPHLSIPQDPFGAQDPLSLERKNLAPVVLGLESLFPLVMAGQWLPDMRIRAGGIDALG